jgi:nanoRNase/pAp phosphatase (c-di-AMP/oligoRNAs hydrolase)
MTQEVSQQIIEKLGKITNVLVIIPPQATGDQIGASLAVFEFLKKLEKEVVVFYPELSGVSDTLQIIQKRFDFLPNVNKIINHLNFSKSFVIDLNTTKSEVEELSYKKETGKLSIYIKPGKEQFTPSDVTFRNSDFPFELIITVGLNSLDQLGTNYDKNTEVFFETPIVNIDYKTSNENYGHYNLIEIAASSVSEVVLDLINKYEATLLDESMATQLLTGIISETNSFQHVRTTPQSFLKASQLISLGAHQQEIINSLYKTKSIGLLKLWGRILARLKNLENLMMVIGVAQNTDIEKSEATNEDISTIIKEMINQLQFAKVFLFLRELPDQTTEVYFATSLPLHLSQIFASFKPKFLALQMVKFNIVAPLAESEKIIIDRIKNEIPNNK